MSKEIVEKISNYYFGSIPKIESLNQNDRNIVYRLDFQGNSKIMKLAKNKLTSKIWKETMLISNLKEKNILVPIIEHQDCQGEMVGQPFLIMDSSGNGTVTDIIDAYIKSDDYNQDLNNFTDTHADLLHQMGNSLAKIHNIKFTQSGDFSLSGIEHRSASQWLHRLHKRTVQLVDHGILSLSELELFQALKMPQIKGLSLCHGDFHGVQCIVDNGQLTAVTDWESAWVGNAFIDLAIAHSYLDLYYPQELNMHFWKGYQQIQILPEDYLDSYLPVRMAHAIGLMTVWYSQGFQLGVVKALNLFRAYAKRIK